jgi:hypothetical protein
VGNLKGRVERLEGGWRGKGLEIIIAHPGETREEVLQKHRVQHLEGEKWMILNLSESAQDSPRAPPPSRPEPQYNAQVPGPVPLHITR